MKVPSVNTNAAGSDSVIYIYYGNTSIAQSVESATGVWDSNYLLVHHLKESSGTLNDSTQYNRDSSAQTGLTYAATGKIGSSLLFDEVDDHYTIADFAYGDTFTVSMWLKVTDNTGSLYQYFYSHDTVDTNPSLNLAIFEDGIAGADDLQAWLGDYVSSNEDVISDVSAGDKNVTDGSWHYVTLTRVKNGTDTLYVDGVSQDTSAGANTSIDPTGSIYIGRTDDGQASRYFGGNLDEIHISNTERGCVPSSVEKFWRSLC